MYFGQTAAATYFHVPGLLTDDRRWAAYLSDFESRDSEIYQARQNQ
jgi:hypothetical protein